MSCKKQFTLAYISLWATEGVLVCSGWVVRTWGCLLVVVARRAAGGRNDGPLPIGGPQTESYPEAPCGGSRQPTVTFLPFHAHWCARVWPRSAYASCAREPFRAEPSQVRTPLSRHLSL